MELERAPLFWLVFAPSMFSTDYLVICARPRVCPVSPHNPVYGTTATESNQASLAESGARLTAGSRANSVAQIASAVLSSLIRGLASEICSVSAEVAPA